jgi:hypothetical protein
MTQRSLHAIINVYYRSMSCFATIFWQTVIAYSTKVSHTNVPSYTMWFRQFIKYITKTNHKVWCHPHSIEHDTPPIAYLISKQVISYRTCGGICCPRMSTRKIQSLANSSMTNHITWRNTTVSIIQILLKPNHQSLPQSKRISTDGRPSRIKTQAKLNITKDEKACTTLITAWLSITNQVWTQFLSLRLRYSIKA